MQKDVELLYLIIKEAQVYFNNCFSFLDISNKLTLSAIALQIFRTKYLGESLIYKLEDNQDAFIRNSYFGGGVDVYKPIGYNLYYYDVNSLYPFTMLKDMPVGRPIYKYYKNLPVLNADFAGFGFFLVNVEYDGNLNIPLLPYKKDGLNLYPKGKWSGTYFSEELKEAAALGYKINIRKGYLFRRGKVFNDYVSDLYQIRQETNDPIVNLIMKLLLNSLYGRFGMKKYSRVCKIVYDYEYKEIETYHSIISCSSCPNGMYVLVYEEKVLEGIKNRKVPIDMSVYQKRRKAVTVKSQSMNIAVQLSSAITSYARVHMHRFKNIPGNICYYSDTDSVFLEKPLDDKFISSRELGAFKLEAANVDAIFLAPKIYIYRYQKEEEEQSSTFTEVKKFKGVPADVVDSLDWNFFLEKYQKSSLFSYQRISNFIRTIAPPRVLVKLYNMSNTFALSKRNKIFNDKGEWVDTEPLDIDAK